MFFQIGNAVVCYFQLLLDHRHPLGEVVVQPHLPGQFFQLGLGHGLRLAVGNQHTDQRHAAGDHSGQNRLHRSHPLTCPSPARWMMAA